MKKKLFNPILALMMLFSFTATYTFGQCVESWKNPSSTVNVSSNVQTIISGAMYPGDYAVININTPGDYQVNTSFGTTLNITDNSNVSIASGNNPLNVTFPSPGLYRIHVCSSNSGGDRVVAISPKNRAFNFDGTDDIISIGTNLTNAIGTTSVLTVEAWVKPSSLTGGGSIISNHNLNTSFCLRRSGDAYNAFIGFGAHGVTSAVNTATLNVWQHVAMVFNSTSVSLYINGSLAGSTTFAPYNLPVNSVGNATCQIGNNGFNEAFQGDIDEVRVWKRALCQSEIQKKKDGIIPTTDNQLLANYHFEHGTVGGNNAGITTLVDASGNNYNGTVTNAALTGATSNWVQSAAYPANGAYPLVDVHPAYTPPSITISGANAICIGSSTTFTASGNVTSYNWISGPTTATIAVTPTTTTTYSVVGTNSLGCQSFMTTKTLTVNPNPTVTVNSGAIYAGQSFTMVPGGASTYTYSSGSAIVSPTTQTNYTVTGANASGCTNTAVSTVSINAEALNFDGSNDFVSLASPITNDFTIEYWVKTSQTGLTGPQWYYGSGIVDAEVGGVTNDFGTALVGSKFAFGIGNPDISIMSTTNINDNNWHHVAATWVKSTGAMAIYVDGISEGTATGPINTRTATQINMGRLQTALRNFAGTIDEVRIWDRALCQGEIQNNMNGEIATTGNGLLANYHFNQGIASASNSTVTTLTDASGNNYNGTLTNFALTGSTSNWVAPGAVTIGSSAPAFVSPTVTITSANAVCNGSSITLTASGDVSTYAWISGPNTATNSVSPSSQTTYSVVGTNSLGCVSNMATQTVSVNALPIVTVSSGVVCAGSTYTMVAGGASTYTYSSGTDVVMPTAQTDYTVTGTDANGCENTAVSTVSVNALPTVTVSSGVVCAGSTYTMIAGGANTYTYSSGTDVVMPTAQTDYTVTGTDANGCENTAVSTVSVNALPTVTVSSGAICSGSSYTMVAGGANTYTYSSGTDVVMPTAQTDYTVTGTDANGCENTAVSTVSVNALPTVTAVTNNTLLCTGFTATLSASGANTYTWSTTENTSDIAVTPTVQTTYTVTGTDANGCENTTTITQDVDACTGIATVTNPNAISVYPNPNNGMFTIELTTQAKVEVVNAIGQTLLAQTLEIGKSSIDIQNQADGIYFVKITTNNHQQIVKVIKK